MKLNILFFRKRTPRWVVFLIDLLIVFGSFVLASLLRFNFSIPDHELKPLLIALPWVLVVRSISFLVSKTYLGIVRYTSTKDAQRILLWVFFGSLMFVLTNIVSYYVLIDQFLIPISIVIIDFIVTVFSMISLRIFVKALYLEYYHTDKEKANVLIYGSGEFGVITKRTLEREPGIHYKIVGFIESLNREIGKKMEGVEVYHVDHLEFIIKKHAISTLIFAKELVSPNRKKDVIEICLRENVKVMTIPPVNKWINGQLKVQQIKQIRIEDLLERPQIVLDAKKIKELNTDKVILVTGAAGSIGSEIVRQLTGYAPAKIILFDQAESSIYDIEMELNESFNYKNFEAIIGDVIDEERLEGVFRKNNISMVYHTAAYKHVPLMECNPGEAVRTNVLGTQILADLANKYGVQQFVFVSTDKAVNPTSVMGASKRIAEMYVQSLNSRSKTNFVTTRFGNVLGSNGSVIPRFRKQIQQGGPVTITHPEITRFFMTIPEACQLVLEAGAMGNGGEIYMFDMGESVKVVDLARKMIRLSGLEPDKDIQLAYTGLRPGEKLYEELLCDKEKDIPTHHPKIMIASIEHHDYDNISQKITSLIEKVYISDDFSLVKKMKDIVPEFISENSSFGKLDPAK